VTEARLLHRLKVRRELHPDIGDLAGPVFVQQLDLFLLVLLVTRLRLLIFKEQLANVVLVLNFLHCLHVVVGPRYVEEFYLRFLQEVGCRLTSRWKHPIVALELEDILQKRRLENPLDVCFHRFHLTVTHKRLVDRRSLHYVEIFTNNDVAGRQLGQIRKKQRHFDLKIMRNLNFDYFSK
jgi:hypothetical protein